MENKKDYEKTSNNFETKNQSCSTTKKEDTINGNRTGLLFFAIVLSGIITGSISGDLVSEGVAILIGGTILLALFIGISYIPKDNLNIESNVNNDHLFNNNVNHNNSVNRSTEPNYLYPASPFHTFRDNNYHH